MKLLRGCLITAILNASVIAAYATEVTAIQSAPTTISTETLVVATSQIMDMDSLTSVNRLNRNLRYIDMSDRVLLAKPNLKSSDIAASNTSSKSDAQSEE